MIFDYLTAIKANESDEMINDKFKTIYNSSIHNSFKNRRIINKVNILNIYGKSYSGKTTFIKKYFNNHIDISSNLMKLLNKDKLNNDETDTIILDNYYAWFDSFAEEKNFILKLIDNKIPKQIKNIVIVTMSELNAGLHRYNPYKSYEDYINMEKKLRDNIYSIHISEILSLYNLRYNPNLEELHYNYL